MSVGSCTFSAVVLAVSLSVGTRKVMIWSLPPCVAPGASTVTWAHADAVPTNTSPTVTPKTVPTRRSCDH